MQFIVKLYSRINSFEDYKTLRTDIDVLEQWCESNLFPLNVTKCCSMTFTPKKNHFDLNYAVNSLFL